MTLDPGAEKGRRQCGEATPLGGPLPLVAICTGVWVGVAQGIGSQRGEKHQRGV